MGRLLNIGKSVLLSGGIISHGSLESYITDSARRALGMGLAEFQDGAVHYFSKDAKILKRAAIQTVSQLAYGALRSYPRFLQYWEQKERDKLIQTKSESSIANKVGQYYQLISEQKAVASKKNYTDRIVGNLVADYLELKIGEDGNYYDAQSCEIKHNKNYGFVTFVDLQPVVQVSSKNNVVLTQVQGRDYTRKEYISGGDMEISISGKIASKYPDIYPEVEVSKFIKLMQYKGIVECDNTVLRQFNIEKLIILNYSFGSTEYRNIQPYTISCVAVEPSESVSLKLADEEKITEAIKKENKWYEMSNVKYARLGAETIDPASLLKLSKLWL